MGVCLGSVGEGLKQRKARTRSEGSKAPRHTASTSVLNLFCSSSKVFLILNRHCHIAPSPTAAASYLDSCLPPCCPFFLSLLASACLSPHTQPHTTHYSTHTLYTTHYAQLNPLHSHTHATEGFALDWSRVVAGRLVTGRHNVCCCGRGVAVSPVCLCCWQQQSQWQHPGGGDCLSVGCWKQQHYQHQTTCSRYMAPLNPAH